MSNGICRVIFFNSSYFADFSQWYATTSGRLRAGPA
jgi:hypothetical protein